MNYMMVQSKHN